METVRSQDGTSIAFDRVGQGPAVIVVTGALGVRAHPMSAELANELAGRFTVYNYDRRGRGDSGDTPPYAVAREVEDIAALIAAAGGSASLYGLSSGAVLALEAAARLPGQVRKLVMFEPPFIVSDARPPAPADYVPRIQALVAAGNRSAAVELFMTEVVGVPAEFLVEMKQAPAGAGADPEEMRPGEWAEMEKVAHTLAYDGMIMDGTMAGQPLPAGRWAAATVPTLVISGGESPDFLTEGAQAIAAALPNARRRVLEGQAHNVSPRALAPLLIEFFEA